ncbi:MAG: lysine--tRNA ligase [Acholeplasmataceae bacterium]|jgi:lysyl-tRNA synthetase class 2|nr:lysine--tRNA ligase [Acholeplasmataceae bacterium]
MDETRLSEQEQIRREKLQELKELGVDPFGSRFNRTHTNTEVIDTYGSFDNETLEEKNETVIVAGRIIRKRVQGKAGFITLQDRDAQLQIYIRQNDVGKIAYQVFLKGDLGDIIGIEGPVFRTRMGELTVKAIKYTHLTKALKPLPDKWGGLQDIEETRRKRYVDLIVNEKSRKVALLRPKIIRSFQKFFDDRGFIEVETPILHPILGGASARPFITHHNTLDMDFYLRIATELPLKRLIVGGLEKVYEIGRLFRNEGMSPQHNPEFTTVEAYEAYSDMAGMMDLVEDVLGYVCYDILGSYEAKYNGKTISFQKGFKRISMTDAIKEATGIDFKNITSFTEAKKLAEKHQINIDKHFDVGHIIEAFFDEFVEKTIVQPTFVYGHPIEISPLAKKSKDNPRFTERFELFIDGREYANAFSELNDPIDQRERFLNQLKERELGNLEANEMDLDYIEALEYGMPPTGGLGIGIDRFIMLLCDVNNIRDIILFPHMKHRNQP